MKQHRHHRRCCVLCGSARQLEEHHVGGRSFEFTVTLCHRHHVTITVGLKRLKIDTSKHAREREHAIRATLYFLWMLFDESENSSGEKA